MLRPQDYPIQIPTFDNSTQEWSETEFQTKEQFVEFVEGIFKEPGKYDFDESVANWKHEALRFNKVKFYCKYPPNTKDFRNYWDFQKRKSRMGAIYKNGDKVWYLSRDYYFWLNFLPIYDKEKGRYDFPNIWDIQYHMALYELLAELSDTHAVILKKRQIASSYFHTAKMLNQYWFEEGAKCKMGASDKKYINENGSWKMLQEYSDFLNEHTAWFRPHNPQKVLNWEQKISVTINGKDYYKGLKSSLSGHTFDKDPTGSVGGPTKIFFYEEGGIAPTADKTYEYMRPALQSGMVTTGIFIIAGSVGELDDCQPLKKYMLNPRQNGFYAVESNLIDGKGTVGVHGLFLPEQWSMPPYIDQYGNSQVEEALEAIKKERKKWKEELDPEDYRLRISQKPTNIKEAFDWRDESLFPLHLITQQLKRIEENHYPYETVDLIETDKGEIIVKKNNRSPIKDFPIKKNDPNKEGTIVLWERPIENPGHGVYYASIDPVSEGKSTTSNSLCSIYIYKNTLEVTKVSEDGSNVHLETGKIVAAWCGRFDDINETHERLRILIEYYNAWALIENNISLFIQHMIAKRKQKYLVPKNQIMFLKDLGANKSAYQDYGWRNVGTLFKSHLISYTIEYIREELDKEVDEEGVTISIIFGVERIPDPMLLREMYEYREGVNVDRLVSFAALVAFIRIQDSNRGYKKIKEESEELDKSQNLFKLNKSAFTNMGKSKSALKRKPRSGFRNIK